MPHNSVCQSRSYALERSAHWLSVLWYYSKGLHTSFASERDPRDPSSIAEVAVLREAYLSGEIDVITWVPGTQNPANPLTKPHAGKTAAILEKFLTEGRLQVDVDDMRHYDPASDEEL